MMSHFTVQGARRRLSEAAMDVRLTRAKDAAFPTGATNKLLEEAVLEWKRAHDTLKRAAATFGTAKDVKEAARETLPK
jgi:hypothetical protein